MKGRATTAWDGTTGPLCMFSLIGVAGEAIGATPAAWGIVIPGTCSSLRRFLALSSRLSSWVRSTMAPARELLDGLFLKGGVTCIPTEDAGREPDGCLGKGAMWPLAVLGRLDTGVEGKLARLRPAKVFDGDAETGLCPGAVCANVSAAGAEGRRCCPMAGGTEVSTGRSIGMEARCCG